MAARITHFHFGAHAVRVIVRNNEPWFVATDVCKALDYKNASDAVATHLDDDERYSQTLERGGSLVIISESGLYALVLRSRKPEARKFAKWVTSEVLPSIRKTGSYSAAEAAPPSLRERRWLISFDHLGNEQHLALDWNDCIIKYADMPGLIESGAIVDADLIARIGQACLAKLLERQQASAHAAQRLRRQGGASQRQLLAA